MDKLSSLLKTTVRLMAAPANCQCSPDDSAVKVIQECLRDFDSNIRMDNDPIMYLLVAGYDEATLTSLYQNDPDRLKAMALWEVAKTEASTILTTIRHGQLCSLHKIIQRKYPILANEWRKVGDIKVDQLPPELKGQLLGLSFTHEEFVRAYLGNVQSFKVYDLTPAWQQWAADHGFHPAYANALSGKHSDKETQEAPFIREDDPRLEWTTPFLGGDKQKALKSLNVLIKSGILSRDFSESEFHNTRKTITGIHALKFSHPEVSETPHKGGKGRPQLSAVEANIAQRIFDAWLAGRLGYNN
jgi:hypothetical protein